MYFLFGALFLKGQIFTNDLLLSDLFIIMTTPPVGGVKNYKKNF